MVGAVQHECIPQAILGMDILCQAKSGMGKTAVFLLSILQQLEPQDKTVSAVVLCHTRELAFQVSARVESTFRVARLCLCLLLRRLAAVLWYSFSCGSVNLQICHEFERFGTYMKHIKVAPFFGGVQTSQNKEQLKADCPHVVVGTPGRVKQVSRRSRVEYYLVSFPRCLIERHSDGLCFAQLAKEGDLKLNKVRHFVLDECDKMLSKIGKSHDH